ncbi:MAG: tetratricopeptide repeat protein [Proteobacteria bacterium]|nr:tetratricopeptide repeat protein [Pseudomonadota bacterium]
MTLQLQFEQALGLQRQGRLAEAERLFSQVAGADPQNFQAHRMTAVVRYQQRKFAEALTAIDAATSVSPGTAEPWVLRGVILQSLSRSDEAVASMNKAAELDPGDINTWYNRGVVLGEIGRFQEAVDSYDRALAIGPHPDALTNRGGVLLSLKRAQEALESCDKALALRPGDLSALCNRALALAELARPEEAVAIFDQVLTQAPNAAQTWSNRGTVLHDLERYAEAVASFDRAVALDPRNATAWTNRGRSLFHIQRFDEARESFERSLTVAPPQTSVDWDSRGDALMGLKRYDAALAAYDAALAMTPSAARLWSKRAATLYMLARFEDALAAADHALALRPNLPVALEMRGKVLLEMKRVEEGLAMLQERGVDRNPRARVPEHKARHDAEQRDYLAARGITAEAGKLYIAGGQRIPGPAVNPANAAIVAKTWAETDPQIVVIDDLLTPEGLEALREFCLGSTMWDRAYDNGYLGALPESGFAAPLLAQIAEELSATFPTVIGDHGLRLLWGFKYDSALKGITIHADQAAVNVNFWITPDDANLNPDRGGLVIYDANAPADWEAADYNGNDPRVWDFLKRVNAKPVTVPYRMNRAVIFDSDLFHETDQLSFKEGYLNRRMNITMLFGRRTFYGN